MGDGIIAAEYARMRSLFDLAEGLLKLDSLCNAILAGMLNPSLEKWPGQHRRPQTGYATQRRTEKIRPSQHPIPVNRQKPWRYL